VLSLITEPKFKTIIWKETAANNQVMQQQVHEWHGIRHTLDKISNISQHEDLEHTVAPDGTYFCDYLHLDNIFTYKQGHGVLFNARQYHCTSNWLKHPEFNSREFLQIHVVSEQVLDLSL